MADKRPERVWLRLVQAYGSRVAESYGPTVPKPWADAIDEATDDQIAYALRKVVRDTPIHPPTLGQFVAACADMPQSHTDSGPSIQALLCAYAANHVHDGGGPIGMSLWEYSRPWTYVYREWTDEARQKGSQKCAECIGLVIELNDGRRLGWSVAAMLADKEGHAKALRAHRPGPKPSEKQRQSWLDITAQATRRMKGEPKETASA
jgi:hypothetical protein